MGAEEELRTQFGTSSTGRRPGSGQAAAEGAGRDVACGQVLLAWRTRKVTLDNNPRWEVLGDPAWALQKFSLLPFCLWLRFPSRLPELEPTVSVLS